MSVPRPVRTGEHREVKRADELGTEDVGRIVQHPGNRGWLKASAPDGDGIFVVTTTGCATYPADAMFSVWGFAERDSVLRRWKRQRAKMMAELAR